MELKKSTGQLERGMESVCAFLNGDGGTVVFGVADNGDVLGQTVGDSTKRDIAECIRQFEPFPLLDVDYVGLDDADKQVIVITVNNNSDKPYVYRGRPYMRVESTTAIMQQYQYKELLEQERNEVISRLLPQRLIDDFVYEAESKTKLEEKIEIAMTLPPIQRDLKILRNAFKWLMSDIF